MKFQKFLILLVLILFPAAAGAESLTGVVRTVNYGSHSFGLDQPPLIRVYVNSGTSFKTLDGSNSFKGLKEGDQATVSGKSTGPGTFIATKVQATGRIKEVKNLAADEIDIKLDQRFLLGVNQEASLKEGGKKTLTLHSTEFINTLCKDGYDCSGEGEVGMRLEVSGGGEKNEIILTSKNHRKPTSPVIVQLHGYEIQLVEAGEDVVLLVVRRAS